MPTRISSRRSSSSTTSGIPLPHNWTTTTTARFGTDYYSRAAVGKSNIFVNSPARPSTSIRTSTATGSSSTAITPTPSPSPAGQLPPVKGFWSLTLYNQHHFFSPNEIKRYSVGTKNKTLVTAPDGSLTIYVQVHSTGRRQASQLAPRTQGKLRSLRALLLARR